MSETVFTPPTEAEALSERVQSDLAAIYALQKSPAFTGYFMRRLNEKLAAIDKQILTGKSIGPELRTLRAKREQLVEIIGLPDTDAAGNRSIAEPAATA